MRERFTTTLDWEREWERQVLVESASWANRRFRFPATPANFSSAVADLVSWTLVSESPYVVVQ